MDRAWALLAYEWKLMLRHRLLVFASLPVVGAFLLSKYGLLVILPVSALVLGIPFTGKMLPEPNRLSIVPTAFTMLGLQAAVYSGITAVFHSAPAIWTIPTSLAVSVAIAAGMLHSK